jgi:predicted transcriptional regulator
MNKLHPVVTKLLVDIEAYCARFDISRSTFGNDAVGDGHFISRIERGKQPRLDTIERVYRYMDRKTKAVRRKSEFITQERRK